MSNENKLVCPNCESTDPPHHNMGWYPAVDVTRVVESIAQVDAQGEGTSYSHNSTVDIQYAECQGCGEVLIDNE